MLHVHIDAPALHLIGRMHGSGGYARTGNPFEMRRPTHAEWVASREKQPRARATPHPGPSEVI